MLLQAAQGRSHPLTRGPGDHNKLRLVCLHAALSRRQPVHGYYHGS
jgi:hypothetical protein